MNKNILNSIKENEMISKIKIVNIHVFHKDIKFFTNEINNDIIYKNIIMENNNIMKYFIDGYIRFIDKKDKNDLLTNLGNNNIKSLFINTFQLYIKSKYDSYLELLDKMERNLDLIDYRKITLKFYDGVRNIINNDCFNISLIKNILDNIGHVDISIYPLSDNINKFYDRSLNTIF